MDRSLQPNWLPPVNDLYEELQNNLTKSQYEEPNLLLRFQHCIVLIREALVELKEYVTRENIFKNASEEILFFKEIKPRFVSQLLFHIEALQIEVRKPIGSWETQQQYLRGELDRLQLLTNYNQPFHQYYRSGATYLDEKYFIRGACDILMELEGNALDADPSFSTSHDYKVARILAHERLIRTLTEAMPDLQRPLETSATQLNANNPVLSWTYSKTALIELLYALQSVGVFNQSTADVKQVATYLEKVFNVELGNYYRTFQEIRIRKSGRTNFLDLLREKLIQRMDEADEH
jgi:hypothetical protein